MGPRLGTVASLVILIGLIPAPPASAGALTVTRTDDPSPDGCAVNGCSLREAVDAANAAPDANSIVVPAGTYALQRSAGTEEDLNATGDIDIMEDTTIVGAGAAVTILDGAGIDRVIDAGQGGTPADVSVAISGLTITGGDTIDNQDSGGIWTTVGLMRLEDVWVVGNTAGSAGGITTPARTAASRSTEG